MPGFSFLLCLLVDCLLEEGQRCTRQSLAWDAQEFSKVKLLKGKRMQKQRDSRVWLRDRKYKLEKHKKVRLGKDKGRGKYHRVWDYLMGKKMKLEC